MRRASLLALAAASLSTGCAAGVARSGLDPGQLTRERVAREFDAAVPTASPDGTSALAFHTSRKVAEPARIDELMTADLLTSGLSEVVYFPRELYRATRTTLFGRDVVVRYDARGRVLSVAVDDQQVFRKVYSADEIGPAAAPAATEPVRPAGAP
jgi:hypothetical protein